MDENEIMLSKETETTPESALPEEHTEAVEEAKPERLGKIVKNLLCLFYCIVFFSLTLLPFLGMIFGWGGENMENRTLAGMPSLIESDSDGYYFNTSFGTEFETYISDNFGFRQEVITVWSAMQYYVFGESAVDDVMTGEDRWLFYSSTAADYEGTNLYSDRMIFRIAKTVELMERYADDSGAAFVFMIAPNKATVCSEYVSSKYDKAEVTNLSRLSDTLSGSDFYIDLAKLFNEEMENGSQYYYKYDSHWNNLGAVEVYGVIQERLSQRLGEDYLWEDYREGLSYEETTRTSDLSTMLLPQLKITETEQELNIEKLYSSKAPITNRLAVSIETTCPGAGGSLYMYRDSFGSSLIDLFSNNYSRVFYSRALPYDLCKAIDGQYNAIAVEIVERNMSEIVARVPVSDAPPCTEPLASEDSDVPVVCRTAVSEGKVTVSGEISEEIELRDEDCIYVEFRAEGHSVYFEAFPICEGDPFNDRGFSVTISEAELLQGEYTMYLHIGTCDSTTAYALYQ